MTRTLKHGHAGQAAQIFENRKGLALQLLVCFLTAADYINSIAKDPSVSAPSWWLVAVAAF